MCTKIIYCVVFNCFCREVFQKYCDAMKELGMKMLDLLSISLGLDQEYLRDFYSDGCSLMRCNYYPCCSVPDEVLGTGPHRDPTSLTILHQDHVGGLEVFSGDKWFTIEPRPTSFVINIGDTLMVHIYVLFPKHSSLYMGLDCLRIFLSFSLRIFNPTVQMMPRLNIPSHQINRMV